LAVAIHVFAIGLLIVSLDFSEPPAGQPPGSEIIAAQAVPEAKVKAEVERLRKAEQKKRDEEQARRRTAERELAAAKAKRQAEERRLAEVKKEKDALEQAKAAEQKALEVTEAKRKQEEQRRVALEKQRVEEERKETEAQVAAEKKQKVEKAEAEKKRKETEAVAEKKRAAAEKKRKEAEALAEKKRAEAEKKRQEAKAEQERQARELAEQIAADEQAARDQSEIERFTRLIKDQIESAFTNPQNGLSCTLLVKMVPGGDVVDAKVVRSSGNELFDRQAEIAVRKASPLPVPDDPRLFQQMREIQFIFDPQA
jgi:colicin import membrane protein